MKLKTLITLIVIFAALVVVGIINRNDSTSDSGDPATPTSESSGEVPAHLASAFPNTDFSKSSIDFSQVLNGGPGKDGIPAIDEPKFVSLEEAGVDPSIQAIVYVGDNEVRAYPYNILDWHEIVNDTVEGRDIAVTFCPLCGSAIVYDRGTTQGPTTFGVSGSLRESNMIMYDRLTETLWQQSTGEAIVGEMLGETLSLLPFQLLTMEEVANNYPEAMVLSTDTGFARDYDRSPYGSYGEDERFIFSPSTVDRSYFVKDIFVITNVDDRSVAIPNNAVSNNDLFRDDETGITVSKTDGEITITDKDGNSLPFYFEMWFSWAVQHENDETAYVFDPS